MNLIPIPSEHCPHCRRPGGQCSMIVTEVETLRAWSIKVNEEDLRSETSGKKSPYHREAYMVQQFLCLKGKGMD